MWTPSGLPMARGTPGGAALPGEARTGHDRVYHRAPRPTGGTTSEGGADDVGDVFRLRKTTGIDELKLTLHAGGTGAISIGGTAANVRPGYATAAVDSGATPYGTAVFRLSQNGVIVSEAAVPASPPTRSERVFIDYRTGVPDGVSTLDINTGLAIAHRAAS